MAASVDNALAAFLLGRMELLARFADPAAQMLMQIGLAERAALLGEQRTGFQAVQQLQQHRAIAFGQGRQ